jgi:hypothetical protein
MALKDWKRLKSKEKIVSEVYSHLLVYRRKSNKDDTLVLRYCYRYDQYGMSDSFIRYRVLRNNISLFNSNIRSEAIKYIKEYMRKN